MVASEVGQFSINVKDNLDALYGKLSKTKRELDALTSKKLALEVDSKNLDALRDKGQRIAAEMKELRQQKTEIKLGMKGDEKLNQLKKELSGVNTGIATINKKKLEIKANPKSVENAEGMLKKLDSSLKTLQSKKISLQADIKSNVSETNQKLKELDKNIASLSRQKHEVELDAQPIRTANTELYKVQNEIDRINNQKVDIKFSDSIKNIGSSMSSLGNSITSKFNPLTSKLNQMFGFGLIEKGIESTTSLIEGSVDSAVERIDTLNNYPKVMKQMGYANTDVTKSLTVLKDSVNGLPTSLTEITKSAQSFAILTGSATKGAQAASAMNHAFIASGASAATAERGTQDYSKMLAEGKVNMQDWNAVAGDMPYALQKVAESFGLTGASAKKDLYEKLKDGDITMEQLNDRFIQLDGGVSGFAATARSATGGIGTAFTNMHTAVTRGVAKIITSFDKILQDGGLGGIAGVASKIGSTLENGLGKVATTIEAHKGQILQFITSLESKFKSLMSFLGKIDYGSFFSGLGEGLSSLKKDATGIFNLIKPIFDVIANVGGNKNTAEGLGKFIPRLFELGVALKVLGGAMKGFGAVGGLLGKITGLKLPKLPSFGGKANEGELPLKNIGIADLKSLGMKMLTLAGLSANIFLAAKAMQEVNKVGDFSKLATKLASMATAVVGMGTVAWTAGKLNQSGVLTEGLLAVAGVAADIYFAAKALEEVAKIDGNFGSIQSKIGQIALAVTEIGALAGAVGFVMDTGVGAAAIVSGLVAIIGIAGTLYLTAEAISKVSKIHLDSEAIQTNITSISKALNSMVKMTVNENLITQLDKIISRLLDLALIEELIGIGHELEAIQNLNLDYSSLEPNMESIGKGIDALTGIKFNESLLTSFLKGGIAGNLKKVVDEIIEITNKFEDLQGRSLISGSLTGEIKIIQDGISSITGIKFNESMVTSWLKGGIAKNIKSVIGTFQEITDEFEDLQGRSLISDTLTSNINTIQTSISSITGIKFNESIISSFLKKGISGNIKSMIQTIIDITDDFEELQGRSLISDSLTDEIKVIQDGINAITGIKFNESVLSSFLKKGISDNLKSMVKTILDITDSLEDIEGRSLIVDSITGEIDIIQTAITAITGIKFNESMLSSFLKKGISKNIKSLIQTLLDITDDFEDLQGRSLVEDSLNDEINIIQTAIDKITGIKFNESTVSSWLKKGIVDNVKNVIETIQGITDDFEDLQGRNLIEDSLDTEIDIIQKAINKITGISFDGVPSLDDTSKVFDVFSEMSKIADSLEDLQGRSLIEDSLLDEINIIKKAVNSLSEFATKDIQNNLTGISTALDSMVNDLTKTFPPEFTTLGNTFAQKINAAFKKKLDLQTVLKDKIKSLSTLGASDIGNKIAAAINDSVKNKLNIGNTIHDSIVKALSANYSTKINVDMVANKVDSSSSSTKYPSVVMATGGVVSSNKGAAVLQDSPEKPLLKNGEYVIPKKIVDKVGLPFFENLRSGRIPRTFAGLAQSVSNTTSSVVNNIYHNTTNNNQSMNVYSHGNQDVMMMSGRRWRG